MTDVSITISAVTVLNAIVIMKRGVIVIENTSLFTRNFEDFAKTLPPLDLSWGCMEVGSI